MIISRITTSICVYRNNGHRHGRDCLILHVTSLTKGMSTFAVQPPLSFDFWNSTQRCEGSAGMYRSRHSQLTLDIQVPSWRSGHRVRSVLVRIEALPCVVEKMPLGHLSPSWRIKVMNACQRSCFWTNSMNAGNGARWTP